MSIDFSDFNTDNYELLGKFTNDKDSIYEQMRQGYLISGSELHFKSGVFCYYDGEDYKYREPDDTQKLEGYLNGITMVYVYKPLKDAIKNSLTGLLKSFKYINTNDLKVLEDFQTLINLKHEIENTVYEFLENNKS